MRKFETSVQELKNDVVRFIHDGAEGALEGTDAAGDALVHVDGGLLVLPHGDGAGDTVSLTGPLLLLDGAVGAHRDTLAAGDTFGVVDGGLVVDDGNALPPVSWMCQSRSSPAPRPRCAAAFIRSGPLSPSG